MLCMYVVDTATFIRCPQNIKFHLPILQYVLHFIALLAHHHRRRSRCRHHHSVGFIFLLPLADRLLLHTSAAVQVALAKGEGMLY